VPEQKNFKKLVRDRMAKTGESYTTARAQLHPPAPATPPVGRDPDTAALARALAAAGIHNPLTGAPFTEQLLFGVAGGIGFAYLVFDYTGWTSVNLDGRCNTLYFEKTGFIETACGRLGLPLRVRPMTNPETTERQLRTALAAVAEVALTIDLVKLPGGTPTQEPYHPHLVTVCPAGDALTVTGLPRGTVTMTWPELLAARWTQARKYGGHYVFTASATVPDVRAALRLAIGHTAEYLLAPNRTSFDGSFGVPGIRKWAALLTDPRDRKGWPKLFPVPDQRRAALDSVVRGLGGPGASGSAHRRLYAAFLDEAAELLDRPALAEVADIYRDLGDRWAAVIQLAAAAVTDADLAGPLPELADAEQAAAQALQAAA
jgi:hypothetical protein